MKLILASKSPRRRQLLKRLGIPFRIVPSGVSEHSTQKKPEKLVQELALRKAMAVAKKVKEGIILGADTLVALNGEVYGQPKDPQQAYRTLYRLSGTTHRVLTGIAVVEAGAGKSRVGVAVSRVFMKKLPLETLLKLSHRHLDKAGAYAIQERRDPIARVVSGSYDNVVGLPLALVKRLLAPFRKPSRGV